MKERFKENFEVNKVFTAVAVFVCFIFLNNLGTRGEPFSAGLAFALMHCGMGIISVSFLFITSFLFNFSLEILIVSLSISIVLCVIYGLFGKRKQMGWASVLFLMASLIPYVLIGGEENYLMRAFTSIVITVSALGFLPAVRAFSVKGFRRPENFEALSFAFLYVCVFTGGIKYMGVDGYKVVVVLSLACLSAVTMGAESCLFSFFMAIPLALSSKSAIVFAPFMLYGGVSYLFSGRGKPIYALTLLTAEICSGYVFGWWGEYNYVNLIYVCAPLIVFMALPDKLFRKVAESLAISADKPLSRSEINRARSLVSGRLYEISATFREISNLFGTLSSSENPFAYEDAIIEEISKTCEDCSFYSKCRAVGFPEREELIRLIAIGKGKGRLTAVDLPKKFSQKCTQTGKILFAINKYVGLYGAEIERKKACEDTRELVALQAEGVAKVLKGMAKNLSKPLIYKSNKEYKLCRFLLKKGVNVQEVMIFGDGEDMEIHLLLLSPSGEISALPSINEFFKTKFAVVEKYDLPHGKKVYVFERANKFDCVFGVSTARKEGASACGDTHSLIKLGRNKFMLALSDGMGSGSTAKITSSASLSLIECLYRAGLPQEVSLSTVNRLLSFSGEDNFTALDLGVVDLETLTCDFIKLGAPYGFIISNGVVKMIEGSSLPMGILKELKPSVCTEPISSGDTILFVSDGITDAFGSATDFADFLALLSATNPQKLADRVLKEAESLYGGVAEDDMTVVACKVFSA